MLVTDKKDGHMQSQYSCDFPVAELPRGTRVRVQSKYHGVKTGLVASCVNDRLLLEDGVLINAVDVSEIVIEKE